MTKIFMSYRRKDWAFTQRLVEHLRRRLTASIFIDEGGIDDDDFNESILSHLHKSHCVVLVVSERTFHPNRINQANDWIHREIAEALKLDLPIVLALYENYPLPKQDQLPADIRPIVNKNGFPFYSTYFDEGTKLLAEFISDVVQKRRRDRRRRTIHIPSPGELLGSILGDPASTNLANVQASNTTTSLPPLVLKLFELARDPTYKEEIGVSRHTTRQSFGLVLENPEKASSPVIGISIRLEIWWRDGNPNPDEPAPQFDTPASYPRWHANRPNILGDQPAVLVFDDPQQNCHYGHPIEWRDFVMTLSRETLTGNFLITYRIATTTPPLTSSGELTISLSG